MLICLDERILAYSYGMHPGCSSVLMDEGVSLLLLWALDTCRVRSCEIEVNQVDLRVVAESLFIPGVTYGEMLFLTTIRSLLRVSDFAIYAKGDKKILRRFFV